VKILMGNGERLEMTATLDTQFDELLVSREFMLDPYPLLRQLREEQPVYWSESIGGWILTRYDDIIATFRDVDHYGNEGRLAKAVDYLPPDTRAKFKTFEDHYRTKGLLFSDPPDHTRLRTLITKALTPRVVESMRPRIQAIADELLDAVQPAGQMDVMRDFAVPLPATVLAEIYGAPVSDRLRLRHWAEALLAFQGVNKPGVETLERTQTALVEIRAYLAALINERRRQPREDLLSQLVAAESEGERLTEAELISTSVTLLVAGHETTTSLIGSSIYTLLHNPEQWRLVHEDPARLRPAIEEVLRYESPVSRQPRVVRADTELGGKTLRKGQTAFQMLNAANRDPAHFADPDRFDLQRQDNRHIGFGFGIHFCVGALLARTESHIALSTVMKRMPAIHLAKDMPDWDVDRRNGRVLKTLPVLF
jgi:pimeloyl-[acyl-carrier protein] synthase